MHAKTYCTSVFGYQIRVLKFFHATTNLKKLELHYL
jgi:hypothetical protein